METAFCRAHTPQSRRTHAPARAKVLCKPFANRRQYPQSRASLSLLFLVRKQLPGTGSKRGKT